MGDTASVRAISTAYLVDVNPLVVAGSLGKLIKPILFERNTTVRSEIIGLDGHEIEYATKYCHGVVRLGNR